jgi:hypothetical protein
MTQYETVKNISDLFIVRIQKERTLTQNDIRTQVEQAHNNNFPGALTSDMIEKLIREQEAHYQTAIGTERELIGEDEGWEHWLPQRSGSIEWNHWTRYRKHLGQGAFAEDVLVRLDSSTDRVVGLIGDPAREGSWDRRGLVVGLVQSGKTAHYVGLINKAVDVGYKVIIVLTGFTESLRVQTQSRIEDGVLGYSKRPHPDKPKDSIKKLCGVELISPLSSPVDSGTTMRDDFKAANARSFQIHIGGHPIVFVVKKHATVLKHLINWVTEFGTAIDAEGRGYVQGVPLLVVDDESDVGSIDTKKGGIDELGEVDEDHDPTKLNKQIRKLLCLFDQSSYVGYTATPFANVLIHDLKMAGTDQEDRLKIGEDLFPRSFIVSLPAPSNHVGPSMVFGSDLGDDDTTEGLPIIREIRDTEIGADKDEQWMPARHRISHKPVYMGKNRIPDSLREAILSFILSCTARWLRGDQDKHNSMLVHVTRFTAVQEIVYDQIERELRGILDRLRNKTATADLLKELKSLWTEDNSSFTSVTEKLNERSEAIFHNGIHTWDAIESELLNIVSSIQVRKINGFTGDILDYEEHPGGLNVIAIGGDKLARGLTLEGLSVSYFLRSSKMYDTLMQMGRWFGYRPGYLDLCRLYTTRELSGWFSHIASATEELRNEFDIMAKSGSTPKEFGLRVRSHPQMMVTSSVKMRDADVIQVSFQGTMVQTVDFGRKPEAVERNWTAAESLIRRIEHDLQLSESKPRDNTAMWTDVPGDAIIDFLDGYKEHKAARKVRTSALKDYIQKQQSKNGLTRWTVLISGTGTSKPVQLGSVSIGCATRGWHIQGTSQNELIKDDHYRIKVLINPPDEGVNLTKQQRKKALELDIEDWETNNHERKGKIVDEPTVPGGRFLRQARNADEGLLILYPLTSDGEETEQKDIPVLGFVISFPRVSELGDTLVSYVVSNVYQRDMATE